MCLTVDRLPSSAIARGEVATLAHEAGDDAVEGAALVVEGLAGLAHTLLTSAEATEVLGSLGDSMGIQLHHLQGPIHHTVRNCKKSHIGSFHEKMPPLGIEPQTSYVIGRYVNGRYALPDML